jgi:hypothetical protein
MIGGEQRMSGVEGVSWLIKHTLHTALGHPGCSPLSEGSAFGNVVTD